MNSPLITLTTDFGLDSPYVAAMKGVIASRAPQARILDLSHCIPPQDIWHGAYFLRDAIPWFPEGSIHVAVVDPGVGTQRAALYVCVDGRHVLCPDNGIWTLIPRLFLSEVRSLTNRKHWLSRVSSTFHGRDIFAPCAAALACGVDPIDLGEPIADWTCLHMPPCNVQAHQVTGEILWIDSFGNLMTNIHRIHTLGEIQKITIGSVILSGIVASYGSASPGELVALFGSNDHLEIAIVNGNAARQFPELRRGTRVEVHF